MRAAAAEVVAAAKAEVRAKVEAAKQASRQGNAVDKIGIEWGLRSGSSGRF